MWSIWSIIVRLPPVKSNSATVLRIIVISQLKSAASRGRDARNAGSFPLMMESDITGAKPHVRQRNRHHPPPCSTSRYVCGLDVALT
jgi:hypothetical protein